MVKKQLFLSGLFCLGIFYSSIEAGYTEKLKGQTRTQLKKIETQIFNEVTHLDAHKIDKKTLAEARQLLDALIKKENFEQFEKSIKEFYKRNLIDDKQKTRFLKKNQLRRDNSAIIKSINDINNDLIVKGLLNEKEIAALVDAQKKLTEDLQLEEKSDKSTKENKQKYAALKAYTALMENVSSGLSSMAFVNSWVLWREDSAYLQQAIAFFSLALLLGKAASYFLLEDQPKVLLLETFIGTLKSVDTVYGVLPEASKNPVQIIGYGAKFVNNIPLLRKISEKLKEVLDEMDEILPLESMA